MGMILSEGEIGTFQECVRRDLLTYVSYPSFKGATRCFAYPQFLVDDETLTLLEDSAFPRQWLSSHGYESYYSP